MAPKLRIQKKFDDLHLGALVEIMLLIGFITIILLPISATWAQTFLIGALVLCALAAAVFDYHT